MVDKTHVDAAIATKEAEVEKLRRKLETAEIELRGMRDLRDKLFAAVGRGFGSASVQAPKRGGRQPGAISPPWRMILSDAFHDYKRSWFPESALPSIAAKHGIEGLRLKDAKERLTSYVQHGYVEQNQTTDDIWRVTENAAKRFGFSEERLTPDTKTAPDLEEAGAV